MSKKAKSDYLIQSVSRALDLLEAFSAKEGALGVTELARKLKLHKNNVFRLLATLETRGYVEQDKETERYRLGAKVYEIAAVFLQHLDLRRQARPYLESLAAKSGETTYLAARERPPAVYVDRVECEQAVRVAPRLGRRYPAVVTAAGQALLAGLPRAQQEAAVTGQAEPGRAPGRPPPARPARAAAAGYGRDQEEGEPGVVAVPAPVHHLARRVVGAVECGAPAFRWTLDRLKGGRAPPVVG